MRARKFPGDYERESKFVGKCLVHPNVDAPVRRIYEMRHGKLPKHVYVCHTCDNGNCILDAHHFPGTQKDNMQDAKIKGRLKRSPATKAILSSLLLGKPKSAEARVHMSIAATGRKATLAARLSMSRAQKGIPMLPEERAKLSAAIMGHPVSAAAKHKISLVLKGRPISEVHKQHIREGLRMRQADKRQFLFEEMMGSIFNHNHNHATAVA